MEVTTRGTDFTCATGCTLAHHSKTVNRIIVQVFG